MIQWITSNLIWTHGQFLIGIAVGLGILSFFFYRRGMYLALFFFIFCFYFFRNPERICLEAQGDSKILVCPADGQVFSVERIGNKISDRAGEGQFFRKVAIFLSPLDVHVNWIPLTGTIDEVAYHKGAFKMAFLDKSSELNERNDIFITNDTRTRIKVRQIAGTIARVIECWVSKGQLVTEGEKFGMIKFGSRVEIFLPKEVDVFVKTGDRVYGGRTVLGRIQ